MRLSLLNHVQTASFGFLLISALSDANAKTQLGQSCEAQWQSLKSSTQNKGQMNYAEFLVNCRTKAPQSTVLKKQSTKTKVNETVILKTAPAVIPPIKMDSAIKLALQKQCLAEWKVSVFANNLKTHPSWRKFLGQCKQRHGTKQKKK